jgi:integrase
LDRSRDRLSAVEIARHAKQPGKKTLMHHDGGGLYLAVDSRGLQLTIDAGGRPADVQGRTPAASWVFRYMIEGKARTAGLGSFPTVKLADARKKAEAMRRTLKVDGVDPLERRDAERTAKRVAAAKSLTFKQCAEAWLASKQDGWRSKKTTLQPKSILERLAYPIIGDMPVSAIDVGSVMRVLEQDVAVDDPKAPPVRLWIGRRDTARKLRGHLEAVLGWAGARNLRTADNPARWDVLKHLLPAPSNLRKVKPVEHHNALPYADVKAFTEALRAQGGAAARALELTILTAARSGETLGATWGEIDLAAKTWTIPTARTKTAEELCVPLSDAAVTLLTTLKPKDQEPDDFVFPGGKPGRPLSSMAMAMMLRRMKRGELTVHGFRSTFRDWGAEQTTYPRELLEKALGHVVGDETERAYQRGHMLERRRVVMEAWAKWCEQGRLPATA